jgi:hypothetical protein
MIGGEVDTGVEPERDVDLEVFGGGLALAELDPCFCFSAD